MQRRGTVGADGRYFGLPRQETGSRALVSLHPRIAPNAAKRVLAAVGAVAAL